MEKTRLPLKCSQGIRTEMRISHFNLKEDLVGKIYVLGGYTSEGGGGCVPQYTP